MSLLSNEEEYENFPPQAGDHMILVLNATPDEVEILGEGPAEYLGNLEPIHPEIYVPRGMGITLPTFRLSNGEEVQTNFPNTDVGYHAPDMQKFQEFVAAFPGRSKVVNITAKQFVQMVADTQNNDPLIALLRSIEEQVRAAEQESEQSAA